MSKPYTDEEYHAAWHAAYGSDTIGDRQVFPVEFRDIRDALDAVAPAIIRRAKAEALREVIEENAISIPDALGYKVRAVFVEDLLDMAAEYERGFGK